MKAEFKEILNDFLGDIHPSCIGRGGTIFCLSVEGIETLLNRCAEAYAEQSNWVSDQDIEQYAWQEANEYSDNEFEQCDIHDNIVAGARWMRNKLLPEPPKQ